MRKRYKMGMVAVLLLLLAVSGCSKKELEIAPEDRILMVNDILYYGTDETGPMGDSGCVEGKIQSSTGAGEVPTENGQSNFGGVGNPYTFDFGDGMIQVFVEDEYFWFYAKDKEAVQEFSEQADALNEALALPGTFPCDFVFASGAGAWGTLVTLNVDGSFIGGYNDSDMGDTGENNPHGTHYFCNFQGKFGNFQKIDEYTTSMTLEEITYENEVGEEWVEDQILYVASEPYGLETGKEFLLYSPETPIMDLSEDFLSWWPNRYTWDGETAASLSCYGILNQETGYGFFSDNICPECGGTISPQTGICNQCGNAFIF